APRRLIAPASSCGRKNVRSKPWRVPRARWKKFLSGRSMGSKSAIATLARVRDTFREAFARKIFWGFFGCSTAVILFFIFLMKIDVVEGALATISLFGKESHATDVTNLVRGVHGSLVAFLYGFGLFLAVFASAGLIPTIF